ncbi:hypothetical protein [Bacillus suaedae]|uniref:Uncharacterized protein n=1 Tax=Halalkalibacter suaedae TaxID=2822140 RepID=A0A941AMA7_9BACI|nr:hypothetical protein [Bacillus suaedae]MBP3950305.1 hypothetical protein [Bacillus suaedae]
MKNRFRVLAEDESLALKLHEFIVGQSKVITALSKQATSFVIESDHDAVQEVYKQIDLTREDIRKAYKDLAQLRKKYIYLCIQTEKRKSINGQVTPDIQINLSIIQGGSNEN